LEDFDDDFDDRGEDDVREPLPADYGLPPDYRLTPERQRFLAIMGKIADTLGWILMVGMWLLLLLIAAGLAAAFFPGFGSASGVAVGVLMVVSFFALMIAAIFGADFIGGIIGRLTGQRGRRREQAYERDWGHWEYRNLETGADYWDRKRDRALGEEVARFFADRGCEVERGESEDPAVVDLLVTRDETKLFVRCDGHKRRVVTKKSARDVVERARALGRRAVIVMHQVRWDAWPDEKARATGFEPVWSGSLADHARSDGLCVPIRPTTRLERLSRRRPPMDCIIAWGDGAGKSSNGPLAQSTQSSPISR
jgi:hypothetical protein